MHESEHFCTYFLAKSQSLWTTFGMLLQHVDGRGGGGGEEGVSSHYVCSDRLILKGENCP